MEFTRSEIYLLLNIRPKDRPLWLVGADLSMTDLVWANLSRANLSGANMSRADLACANLEGPACERRFPSGPTYAKSTCVGRT